MVRGGKGRFGEIALEELNCIRKNNIHGDGIGHVEASVVLESRANVESLATAEVP